MILQALRAASRISAPATIHLAEAIVAPAEMLPYLGRGQHDGREGNLAYHNSLMVQFWSALATRDTRLMSHVLATHFPPKLTNATYATYIRCHDDIGWAVTDEDAGALGLSGPAHRAYLSDFYEGSFPGSFSRGALFQHNEATGDKRISGSFASLAGLESALESGDATAIDHAVNRILMGHAMIAAFGGIPLVYMGDELALLNDRSYLAVPEHAHDSRWIHRPRMDWALAETRHGGDSPAARVFAGTRHILHRRRATAALHAGNATRIIPCDSPRIFAFTRETPTGNLLCLFNFSESWVNLPVGWLLAQGIRNLHDELSDHPVAVHDGQIALPPFARAWIS